MKKLLYFSGTWCKPCKSFKPIMSQARQAGVVVEDVDVDQAQHIALKYNVRSIPTVILLNGEQEVNRFVGTRSLTEVINFWNGN